MKPLAVVEVEVFVQARTGLGDTFVLGQVDGFVFDATPRSLDEAVVPGAPAPIPTDRTLAFFEQSRESLARALPAWIRLENLRPRLCQRRRQGARAEIRFPPGRDFPPPHITRVPVQHRRQGHKAALHAEVRAVCAPHLIAAGAFQTAPQGRSKWLPGAGLRQARLLINRFQTPPPPPAARPSGAACRRRVAACIAHPVRAAAASCPPAPAALEKRSAHAVTRSVRIVAPDSSSRAAAHSAGAVQQRKAPAFFLSPSNSTLSCPIC